MTFKSLCAGLAVALAASTLGCGTSMTPTPPTPEREPATVSDQTADAARPADEAQSAAPADVRPQYQTQAVVVRRAVPRPVVVAPRPVVVAPRRPVVVAPRRPVVAAPRPVVRTRGPARR